MSASKIGSQNSTGLPSSHRDSGMVIWLTGFSGAGKSTLAAAVASSLEGVGLRTETLDADDLRATINRDLGFSKHDRDENVRRIAHR
jgi:adenylylsulfate kinase-like enzyme